MSAFSPTHRTPKGGLAAWEAPDPGRPPGPRLDPRLDVEVVESRPDGWARVVCANGWSAWVDGRLLEAARPDLPPGVAAASPYVLAGAALVLLGTLLPWLSSGGVSIPAWRLPLRLLAFGSDGQGAPSTGLFLLLVVAVLVGPPLVTRQRLPPWALFLLTALVPNLALFAVLRAVKPRPQPTPGAGAVLALVGGILMTVETWRRTWPAVQAWAAARAGPAHREA